MRRRVPPTAAPMLLGAAVATVEGALLLAVGAGPDLGVAAQATAPGALGVFHDVRWILGWHQSWPAFVGEAVLALAVRSLLTAGFAWLAWPGGGTPRPSFVALLRRALAFVAVAMVLLSYPAVLMFATGAFAVGWMFVSGMGFALLFAGVLQAAVVPGGCWWRPPARSIGWLLLAVVGLSAGGAAAAMAPGWAGLAAVAATGGFTGYVWRGTVGALVAPADAPRLVPLLPATAALSAAVVVGAGVLFAATPGEAATLSRVGSVGATASDPVPVLFASGWRSAWDGHTMDPLGAPYQEVRFSYRGLGRNGRPLAYTAADTYRSLPSLVRLMRRQVDVLARRFGRKVTVVASSEGTLVAKTYLMTTPRAPVGALLDFSPILESGRVDYPAPGRGGWGQVAKAGLTADTDTLELMGFGRLSPDTPILRSMVAMAPLLRYGMGCPVPGVPEVDFVPLQDALATLPGWWPHVRVVVVPATHGTISTPHNVRAALLALANGRRPPSQPVSPVAYQVLRGAASGWQVPAVPLSLPSGWQDAAQRVGPDCRG